jgi:hypothetical protein
MIVRSVALLRREQAAECCLIAWRGQRELRNNSPHKVLLVLLGLVGLLAGRCRPGSPRGQARGLAAGT